MLGAIPVLLGMQYFGQTNLTTAALMYLPPFLWIAPAFALMVPAVFLDWKSLVALALVTVFFFTVHLDYQWASSTEIADSVPPADTIRLLTWNRGQSKHASLHPLKDVLKPDFILLQDAARQAAGYKTDKNYADFLSVATTGEFVLMSRWPVTSTEELSVTPSATPIKGNAFAARFEVNLSGRPIIIYTVHLPTPRDELDSYRRGAFLWGILGIPGTPGEAKKRHYQAFWDHQIELSRQLLARVRAETHPVLVMGDFNTPAMGPMYDMFAEHLQDAHCEAGSGFGFTFPADTHNPISLFRPWLRLDQIFLSSQWQVLQCNPLSLKAQHFPVFAEVKLRPPSPH